MNVIDPASNALNVIHNSQHKVNQAAHDIATSAINKDEVGKPSEYDSRSVLAPLLSLKEASSEAQAGVKLLEVDNEMKKSIIDLFV